MEFVKVRKVARFQNPNDGYRDVERFFEVRYDPLTGHSMRILHMPIHDLPPADLEELVSKSQSCCPFCPQNISTVTPKFIGDSGLQERYARGEALCFPNAYPYDENAAVAVLSHEHFLGLTDFKEHEISNALNCCITYLDDLSLANPDHSSQSINWNYMPLAGGSLVHPHLQATASELSTTYCRQMLSALGDYREREKRGFWDVLLEHERLLDERLVAENDHMQWLVAFAPMGVFDLIGLMPEVRRPRDMQPALIRELVSGILSFMRYIDSLNMYSFNMAIYFMLDEAEFTTHVRLCPRVSIPPFGASQVNYMKMLHNENMTILQPEDVRDGLQRYWQV